MNKVYVITAATALSLGWVAGFETQGLTAKAALPHQTSRDLTIEVTPGQQATIESWAQARFCSQVNEEFGLSGPQGCSGAKSFQRLILHWQPDEQGVRRMHAEARVLVRGQWTPESAD